MSINVSEVIWTIICFFALLFVLKKFLFDPLIRFMDDRKARIEAGLSQAREAKREQEEREAELQERWKARSDEAKQLVTDGKAADEQVRTTVLHKAQAEAAQAECDARERVAQERTAAQNEVSEQMDELVTVLTQQLLPNETE